MPEPQATTPKPMTAIQIFSATLERSEMMEKFKKALPDNIKVEKFIRVVVSAVTTAKDSEGLLNADRDSLYVSCMRAAQDGLMPDGHEAALVVFRDNKAGVSKVSYMPMYAGILKKVRNSGEMSTLTAQIIKKNDKFRHWIDDSGEHISHEEAAFGSDRGETMGAYALAKMKDGGIYVEVMTLADLNKVKAISRSKDYGPWKEWEEEMQKKTVIRRLAKRLPMSTDLERVVTREDETVILDAEAQPQAIEPPKQSSRLAAVVSAQTPAPQAQPPAAQPQQSSTQAEDSPI